MKIGFDVDEVILKTIERLLEAINEMFGTKIAFNEIVYYDFNQVKFCKDPAKNALIKKATQELIDSEDFFLNLKSYEDVVKLVNDLAEKGHKIYLITSRPDFLSEVTIKSLERCGVTYEELICTKEKGPHVKSLKLEVFVDDYHENLYSIREKHPECQLFLLDRPWNQECDDFIRIFDCREMISCLNL